ncbi:MAG: hypothetical protein COV29_03180 [Candidatus Yanofskybacteria bacterium CG10_big_fil_rev_8_21_14_0_10_36_16]|uniref:SCP domain-containing protein n=1 Tax=Candidatus Yanofskybacteria bacterium CG10_big_fil_rev_8_21_14_0_10_36_16 TaxID=1975096 RepID=A0A2J0Q791_9BACT|nr:MAG: hypothetical protein COV29_03180 [Candidatus Yanofskybacteria bacterium CG10_big_fil_rev_8_21_14_0_10_36_16]
MKPKFLIITIALSITAFLFFNGIFFDFSEKLDEAKDVLDREIIQEIKKDILTPPPLRVDKEESVEDSFLTKTGVLNWTNVNRNENGLSSLKHNSALELAASLKINDMLQGQYFDHVSPSGVGPEFWVNEVGYAYIMTGENLALGNFEDDQDLVQAWMDSPGHRANILNERFTEIGVAVGQGLFEDRRTWLAVQVFGLPESACPEPVNTLKTQLEAYSDQAEILRERLNKLKFEIDNTEPKRGQEYNRLVKEYNDLVNQYNNIASEIERLADVYNGQVVEFNNCIKGN